MKDSFALKFAEPADLPSWMELVTLVRNNFPGLESDVELEKHRQIVEKNISRKTAICAVNEKNAVIGVLLFSLNQNGLSCMAVHPAYRRNGIASAMIEKALSVLPAGKDVWVTTFREGDEKGIAPRALYKKFGFIEGELITEHNYPNQKFVLHRPYYPPRR